MTRPAFAFLAASLVSGAAMAQSETTIAFEAVDATVQSEITPDFTFDLDRTVDASLAPLPSGAGDYEVAGPGEVVAPVSYTFDLR